MNMLQKVLRAVDELQQRHAWLAFPVAVWKKFGDDQAGNLAALIAYSALVAIFPLLLLRSPCWTSCSRTIPRGSSSW